MKIVFFGTANVALPVIEALKKEHEILLVVTTPDVKSGRKQELSESPVSALAIDLSLPILKPEKVKGNIDFFEHLKNLNADIFVVVAYGKILPLEIINLPKYKTVNVHFSVLPKYRGPSPIQSALLNGETQTGTSIFILDENVDTGPLIGQEIANIDLGDNFFTLSDKLARASAKAINSTLNDYVIGKITPLPQDLNSSSRTKIITKEDGKVDWSLSSEKIYNQFRAFYIWPGIWTTWNGEKLKITDCVTTELETESTTEDHRIGEVKAGGVVVCGNGSWLKINRLQLAGKNEVGISDFLNGYKNFTGSNLG